MLKKTTTVKKAPAKKAIAKKAVAKPAAAKKVTAKKVAPKAAPAKKTPAKKIVKVAKPAKATKKIVKAKAAPKAKAAKKAAPKAKKTVAKKPAKKVAAKAKKPAKGSGKSKPKAKPLKKPALKAKKLVAKVKKPAALPKRLAKPWPVSRIRSLMTAWGMSQVEFAIFSGVSYDSVTSWCRGRRRLVRRETAEHLEKAEKISSGRKFAKSAEQGKTWKALKDYCETYYLNPEPTGKELKSFDGTFPLMAVETTPLKVRKATQNEKVIVKMTGKTAAKVTLFIGRQKVEFEGIAHQMGGAMALELVASAKEKKFLAGRAGCITFLQGMLRLSLWSTGSYPVRMVGVPK